MADAIQSGISALQSALTNNSGDVNDFAGAVSAMQAAGNSAVSTVGPAIDTLSKQDPATMANTQLAWQQNSMLASVQNTAAAGRPDVDLAASYLQQMISFYNSAYAQAKKASAPPPVATPAVAAAPKNVSPVMPVSATAAAVTTSSISVGEVTAIGGGALLGLAAGMRFVGGAVGGPVGLAIGTGLGYFLGKWLKGKGV